MSRTMDVIQNIECMLHTEILTARESAEFKALLSALRKVMYSAEFENGDAVTVCRFPDAFITNKVANFISDHELYVDGGLDGTCIMYFSDEVDYCYDDDDDFDGFLDDDHYDIDCCDDDDSNGQN